MFGIDQIEQLLESQINKSVLAGDLTGQQTIGLDRPPVEIAKYESLKENVIELSPQLEQFRMYPLMPHVQIFDTVHQYVQQTSVGNMMSMGLSEGEIPEAVTSEGKRRSEPISYIGELRKTSVPAQTVKNIWGNGQNVVTKSIRDGITNVTKTLNYLTVYGNKKVLPKYFNGLVELHSDLEFWTTKDLYQDSSSVIDLRNNGFGGSLTTVAINDAVLSVADTGLGNVGALKLFMTPATLTKYVNDLNTVVTQFATLGTPSQNAGAGLNQRNFASALGDIPFVTDIFIGKRIKKFTTDLATSNKAPNVVTSPAVTLPTDTNTRFADSAGDYFYAVTAVNQYGESAPVAISGSLVSVLATQAVDLAFTDGGGVYQATGYNIYRSEKDPATPLATTPLYPIFSVGKDEKSAGYDGAGATLIRDKNRVIANTDDAWLIQWDSMTIEFAHLFDGIQQVTFPNALNGFWGSNMGIYMMGMPLLYAPLRVTRFMNIKR